MSRRKSLREMFQSKNLHSKVWSKRRTHLKNIFHSGNMQIFEHLKLDSLHKPSMYKMFGTMQRYCQSWLIARSPKHKWHWKCVYDPKNVSLFHQARMWSRFPRDSKLALKYQLLNKTKVLIARETSEISRTFIVLIHISSTQPKLTKTAENLWISYIS